MIQLLMSNSLVSWFLSLIHKFPFEVQCFLKTHGFLSSLQNLHFFHSSLHVHAYKKTKLNNKMNKAQTAQQPWAPAACLFPRLVLACLLLCSVETFDEEKKQKDKKTKTQLLLMKKRNDLTCMCRQCRCCKCFTILFYCDMYNINNPDARIKKWNCKWL